MKEESNVSGEVYGSRSSRSSKSSGSSVSGVRGDGVGVCECVCGER